MSFGKHRGELLKDIPTEYFRRLVKWATEQNLQYKLKGFSVAKEELARRSAK